MKLIAAYFLAGLTLMSAVLPVQMGRCHAFLDVPLRTVVANYVAGIIVWPMVFTSVVILGNDKCATRTP